MVENEEWGDVQIVKIEDDKRTILESEIKDNETDEIWKVDLAKREMRMIRQGILELIESKRLHLKELLFGGYLSFRLETQDYF